VRPEELVNEKCQRPRDIRACCSVPQSPAPLRTLKDKVLNSYFGGTQISYSLDANFGSFATLPDVYMNRSTELVFYTYKHTSLCLSVV
jgi:hypothetical protein